MKWNPTTLRNPRTRDHDYFTPEAAWQFIADALDEGVTVYQRVLEHPSGKKAFYFVVPGHPPVSEIYVKLQLVHDKVLCRSFHESDSRSKREIP